MCDSEEGGMLPRVLMIVSGFIVDLQPLEDAKDTVQTKNIKLKGELRYEKLHEY